MRGSVIGKKNCVTAGILTSTFTYKMHAVSPAVGLGFRPATTVVHTSDYCRAHFCAGLEMNRMVELLVWQLPKFEMRATCMFGLLVRVLFGWSYTRRRESEKVQRTERTRDERGWLP